MGLIEGIKVKVPYSFRLRFVKNFLSFNFYQGLIGFQLTPFWLAKDAL